MDYSIFAGEWTRLPAGKSMLAQEWTCPHGTRAGLLYSHRGCIAVRELTNEYSTISRLLHCLTM